MAMGGPGTGQRRVDRRPPSGLRRLSLAMLATGKTAEGFAGLSEGQGSPATVLAAFKAAAPYLGLSPRLVHAVDWLFRFTQAQDWQKGSRPIVWPSAAIQREALGLGPTQVKALNRALVELGLVAMRDSPNGKRYGRRDRAGQIIEAYGFDLSPLAARLDEFQAVAEKGRAEREERRQLRRRATIARNGLMQIIETVAELGLLDAAWQRQAQEARKLAQALSKVERLAELAVGVAQLERRQSEARERLEHLLAEARVHSSKTVDSDPRGPEYRPHQYNYKPSLDPDQDTVMAPEESKSGAARANLSPNRWAWRPTSPDRQGREEAPDGRTDRRTVLRLTPDELVRLAPRLRSYLVRPTPHWPEVVEAADWLRHDLGVSQPLWGEACLVLGREQAAIALAIVSTKPAGHFRTSPGGYFRGMVVKAKAGELNLARTVWGLRQSGSDGFADPVGVTKFTEADRLRDPEQ